MGNNTVVFHDRVLDDIQHHIGDHAPERGGALLGPIGEPIVSVFLFDPEAATTEVTYVPSERLRRRVAEWEASHSDLELKGIIHSHPGSMDYPSGGDHDAYADSLRRAPWLGRFVCPIVTLDRRRRRTGSSSVSHAHEIPLDGAVISVYVSEPRKEGPVVVKQALARVLSVHADADLIAEQVGGTATIGEQHTQIDGLPYASALIESPSSDLSVLFPRDYPTVAPVILQTSPTDGTRTIPLLWDLALEHPERLTSSLAASAAFAAEPPVDVAAVDVAREGLGARLDGVVDSSMRDQHVMIVGLGSGGSQTAEALARAGIERFTLIDPDTVEAPNLSRSVYRMRDLGIAKADALARHLREINPAIDARTLIVTLQDLPRPELKRLIAESDLVVAATDDPRAQFVLNRVAWKQQVPAVFASVYARARAGEIVFTVPGLTRCFRCAVARRASSSRDGQELDYGTGQLRAEPALGADIAHIVTMSVKISLGIMHLAQGATVDASQLVARALEHGKTFVITSTMPEFDFFPKLFGAVPGQLAYQTVWMEVVGDDECPVCGVEPSDAERRVPDVNKLYDLANARETEPDDGTVTEHDLEHDNEPGPVSVPLRASSKNRAGRWLGGIARRLLLLMPWRKPRE